ncbi:MAG: hypothetical protein ACI8X5_000569 [Planctomycetota bacterium]|jgi:uncharacterized protein (TIGR00730 family)
MKLRRICLFCGSSAGVDPAYVQAAEQFGRTLAEQGIGLVYGGGSVGLMGAAADAALAAGGEVIGVIPTAIRDLEVDHKGLTEMHVVDSMHIRKQLMHDFSDAFITLPGGHGTFDELFETITWLQLGYHEKPVGLLNVAGYYDALLAMLDGSLKQGFLTPFVRELLLAETDLDALLSRMQAWKAPDLKQWLARHDL